MTQTNNILAKVVKVDADSLEFDNGLVLSSDHESDCCEQHYLSFEDVTLSDFDGLEFDLSADTFFKRIEDYGIELIPVKGYSVKVPGYGHNNGYYSDQLNLILSDGKGFHKGYDITECQTISAD